jgi:transcriptional regulator with XRE-family HTH domain
MRKARGETPPSAERRTQREEFGRRLQTKREALGLSRSDLAKRMSDIDIVPNGQPTSPEMVRRLELGQARLEVDVVWQAALALPCQVTDLLPFPVELPTLEEWTVQGLRLIVDEAIEPYRLALDREEVRDLLAGLATLSEKRPDWVKVFAESVRAQVMGLAPERAATHAALRRQVSRMTPEDFDRQRRSTAATAARIAGEMGDGK